MRRNSLVYALLATLLFICFLSFLESKKANASLGFIDSENAWILDQWIIAEAIEQESQKDVTDLYSSEVWQFLNSNGFVQFRGKVIENTGEWVINKNVITIQRDGEDNKRVYLVEKAGRNELILNGKELKVRLLKLEKIF